MSGCLVSGYVWFPARVGCSWKGAWKEWASALTETLRKLTCTWLLGMDLIEYAVFAYYFAEHFYGVRGLYW